MSLGPCRTYATACVGEHYGFEISWFAIQTCLLCLVGLATVMISMLRTLREELFPLYMGYLLFTGFTLTIQAVQQFFPKGTVPPYSSVTECILAATIAMQWFVHTSTVMYLLERNPGRMATPRRVIYYAGFGTICLLTIWSCGALFDRLGIAELVVELLLVVFFGSILFVQHSGVRRLLGFRSAFYLRGRPAITLWCTFEILAHGYFCVMYGLRDLGSPSDDLGWCLYVGGDSLYYAIYPYVLVAVVRMDTKYWKQSGALINDMRTVLESEDDRLLSINGEGADQQIVAVGDFQLIPFSQLEFKEQIGSGGFSVVYKANFQGARKFVVGSRLVLLLLLFFHKKQTKTHAVVAVKIFRPASSQLETMNDLIKEARVLQAMRHENICSLIGISMRGESHKDRDDLDSSLLQADMAPKDVLLCAVLQYCSGGSLFTLLHNPPARGSSDGLSRSLLFRIVRDIAVGMAYLHSMGMMHRDLKTPNILLDENLRAIISDFGLAKGGVNPTASAGVTMTAIGTPHYMSPELLRGEHCTLKSDVWSFGVIVWECMTRTIPYSGMNPIMVMQLVAHEGMKPSLSADQLRLLPPTLVEIFNACIASDASARPTFAELTVTLQQQHQDY